jgi:hypothetical protein
MTHCEIYLGSFNHAVSRIESCMRDFRKHGWRTKTEERFNRASDDLKHSMEWMRERIEEVPGPMHGDNSSITAIGAMTPGQRREARRIACIIAREIGKEMPGL